MLLLFSAKLIDIQNKDKNQRAGKYPEAGRNQWNNRLLG